MTIRPILTMIVSGAVAATVWLFSKYFTGHPEPWGGNFSYYIAGLFLSGFVSALISPLPLWEHYLGTVIGQVIYMILSIGGPFLLLGIIFSAMYSVAAMFGVALAIAIRYALLPKE